MDTVVSETMENSAGKEQDLQSVDHSHFENVDFERSQADEETRSPQQMGNSSSCEIADSVKEDAEVVADESICDSVIGECATPKSVQDMNAASSSAKGESNHSDHENTIVISDSDSNVAVSEDDEPKRLNIETAYRVSRRGGDSSSSDSSEDSSSETSDGGMFDSDNSAATKRMEIPIQNDTPKRKTPHYDMGLEDLPPIENLKITVDENVEMMEIGCVTSTVGVLVIIQTYTNTPALNEETILFLQGRKSLGKIFEIFGPVPQPYYSVRFNSTDEIEDRHIKIGTLVYCAPKCDEYTNYVFIQQLLQIKGSDASWVDNVEPPAEHLDYSDDEEETRAKQLAKREKRNRAIEKRAEGGESDEQSDVSSGDEQDEKKQNRKKKKRTPRQRPVSESHGFQGTGFHQAGYKQWPPNDGPPSRGLPRTATGGIRFVQPIDGNQSMNRSGNPQWPWQQRENPFNRFLGNENTSSGREQISDWRSANTSSGRDRISDRRNENTSSGRERISDSRNEKSSYGGEQISDRRNENTSYGKEQISDRRSSHWPSRGRGRGDFHMNAGPHRDNTQNRSQRDGDRGMDYHCEDRSQSEQWNRPIREERLPNRMNAQQPPHIISPGVFQFGSGRPTDIPPSVNRCRQQPTSHNTPQLGQCSNMPQPGIMPNTNLPPPLLSLNLPPPQNLQNNVDQFASNVNSANQIAAPNEAPPCQNCAHCKQHSVPQPTNMASDGQIRNNTNALPSNTGFVPQQPPTRFNYNRPPPVFGGTPFPQAPPIVSDGPTPAMQPMMSNQPPAMQMMNNTFPNRNHGNSGPNYFQGGQR